jgi:hypothetical protein
MEIGGVSSSTPGLSLKKALEIKASKYRNLPHPYFIAINARGFHDTEDDYLAATYGSDAVQISLGVDGEKVGEPRWVRLTNGLYNDGGRARKTNVSGVIFFNGVAPWNWSDRRCCLIHNAYSTSPLFKLSLGGDAYVPTGGTLNKIHGKNVGDLIALD